MEESVDRIMKMQGDAAGELEEGELTSGSGNESDDSVGVLSHHKVRRLAPFESHDALKRIRESSNRRPHYGPTPPRGYRTPAGQRLRDRRRPSPPPSLKFKYHGTMDLIRKSSNSYSSPIGFSGWRPAFGSPLPSPARKPDRAGKTGPAVHYNSSPGPNVNNNNKQRNTHSNIHSIKELNIKKPLRKKLLPKSLQTVRPPPSPDGDIEDLDYIDLLLEYKQIQKQLEHLSKEEADTVTESKTDAKEEQLDLQPDSQPDPQPDPQLDVKQEPQPDSQPDLQPDSSTSQQKTEEEKTVSEGNDKLQVEEKPAEILQLEEKASIKNEAKEEKEPKESSGAEVAPEIEEDEAQRLIEEKELNELRLAALASVAKGGSPALTKEKGSTEGAKSRHEKPVKRDRRGSSRSDATKRSKDSGHRENLPVKRKRTLEDEREKNLRRNRDDRRGLIDWNRRERETWLRRDRDERIERRDRDWRMREDRLDRDDRRSIESERRNRQSMESDLQKSDDRSLSLARVLTLDSHEEQVDRFVQMLQDRNEQGVNSRKENILMQGRHIESYEEQVDDFVRRMNGDQMAAVRPSPRSWSKEWEYWNRLLDDRIDTRDNYEEVEMDLGSGPASPVPGFVDMDQEAQMNSISRFPIEFPHHLPYDTDFLLHSNQHMESMFPSRPVEIIPFIGPSELHLAASLPPPPPPPPPSSPPPPAPALPPFLPLPNYSPEVEVVLAHDKVSSSAKSDTSEDNQEEDDEDEDLLRAALLYELAQKRREQIEYESAGSSPVPPEALPKLNMSIPRTDSSHSLHTMPLVEPVVITIGNESSDESDSETAKANRKVTVGLDGQLDLFLALQRQTVEDKMKLGKDGQATDSPKRSSKSDPVERAQELEAQLRKVRASLVQDESRLSAVRSQLSKRKRALMTAELKAAKLKEQLAAAERIIAVTKDQTERLNAEAGRLQNRINATYSQAEEFEKQTLSAGKVAYGEAYNLGIRLKPNDAVQPNKSQAESNKTAKEKLAEDIAREKARLKEREREVAEKLKSLKEVQAKARAKKKNTAKKNTAKLKPRHVKLSSDKSEYIHTTPVMSFNFGPEVEKEITVITPRRRRSLADMSPSTVPNLPNLPIEVSKSSNDTTNNDQKGTSDQQKPKFNFVMPNGKQMASLNKMLGVSKIPANARHPNLTVRYQFGSEEFLATSQLSVVSGNKSMKHSDGNPTGLRKYSSPLQMFRAYRLSPYFRTKSKNTLTSETFTHKLDHQRLLCHYDLHGKCQDEKCAWQHKGNYQPSKKEVLMDIAAYLPSIADVKPKTNPAEMQKKLGEYVEEFQKKNSQFNHEQQCLLLLSEVISKAQRKLPHMMLYDARRWKPSQPRNDTPSTVGDSKVQWSSKGSLDLASVDDDVLLDGDIRYWMLGSSDVQDMETAVLDTPNNINLWINLANKKLHNPKQSQDKNLDSCLNVLSRGLELNRTSSELWLYYLKMYSQRSKGSEMRHLCKQALKYAPTYHLHCKFLNLLESYQEREEHCDVILSWLVTEAQLSEELRSHWMLETLLYKVALATNCGRFRNALKALQQVVLGSSDGPDWIPELLSQLTTQDTSLLWLCYIHLVEFRYLPPSLFDPANAHRNTVVSKEPFLFPWDMGKPPRNSVEYLESRFQEAVEVVKAKEKAGKLSEYEWHIHKNWIWMDVVGHRWDNARNKCRQLLLESGPVSVEIWQLLFSIEKWSGNMSQARQVLEEAQGQFPYSSHLVHSAAMFELSQGDVDGALEKLEFGVVNMFDVSLDDKRADPNLLYCKCLSQPVPLKYNCPKMKDEVQDVYLPKQELHLWLNYWLLLELHGDRTQANEVFELALGVLRSPEHIHTLWRRYIQYQLFQFSQQSSSNNTPVKVTENKLVDLLYRALLSVPSKAEVPLQPGLYWLDYSGHNDLIDMVLGCLPDHCLTPFYEKLMVWMPNNVVLTQRACEHFIKEGNRAAARGISLTALQHHPACLPLWKIHMAQVQKEGSYSEVKKLYRRALKHIDLTLSLWKDLLVFEIVCGNEKSVEQVIMQCEEKGLNIHDFLTSICGNGEVVRPMPLVWGSKLTRPPLTKT